MGSKHPSYGVVVFGCTAKRKEGGGWEGRSVGEDDGFLM